MSPWKQRKEFWAATKYQPYSMAVNAGLSSPHMKRRHEKKENIVLHTYAEKSGDCSCKQRECFNENINEKDTYIQKQRELKFIGHIIRK